jgi:hypothetical protein
MSNFRQDLSGFRYGHIGLGIGAFAARRSPNGCRLSDRQQGGCTAAMPTTPEISLRDSFCLLFALSLAPEVLRKTTISERFRPQEAVGIGFGIRAFRLSLNPQPGKYWNRSPYFRRLRLLCVSCGARLTD